MFTATLLRNTKYGGMNEGYIPEMEKSGGVDGFKMSVSTIWLSDAPCSITPAGFKFLNICAAPLLLEFVKHDKSDKATVNPHGQAEYYKLSCLCFG